MPAHPPGHPTYPVVGAVWGGRQLRQLGRIARDPANCCSVGGTAALRHGGGGGRAAGGGGAAAGGSGGGAGRGGGRARQGEGVPVRGRVRASHRDLHCHHPHGALAPHRGALLHHAQPLPGQPLPVRRLRGAGGRVAGREGGLRPGLPAPRVARGAHPPALPRPRQPLAVRRRAPQQPGAGARQQGPLAGHGLGARRGARVSAQHNVQLQAGGLRHGRGRAARLGARPPAQGGARAHPAVQAVPAVARAPHAPRHALLRLHGRRGALPRGPGGARRLRRPRHRHGAGRVREPVGVQRALVLLRLLQVVQPVRPVRVARAVRLVDRQRRVPAVGRRHAPGGQPQPHQRPGRDVLRVPDRENVFLPATGDGCTSGRR